MTIDLQPEGSSSVTADSHHLAYPIGASPFLGNALKTSISSPSSIIDAWCFDDFSMKTSLISRVEFGDHSSPLNPDSVNHGCFCKKDKTLSFQMRQFSRWRVIKLNTKATEMLLLTRPQPLLPETELVLRKCIPWQLHPTTFQSQIGHERLYLGGPKFTQSPPKKGGETVKSFVSWRPTKIRQWSSLNPWIP